MAARPASPPPLPTEGGTHELQGGRWVCTQQTAMPAAEPPADPAPATTDNPED